MSAVIQKEVITEAEPRLPTARHWIGGSENLGDTSNPPVRSSAAAREAALQRCEAPSIGQVVSFAGKIAQDAGHVARRWRTLRGTCEKLAHLMTIENGKALLHGGFEIGIVPLTLRFKAALALSDCGRRAGIDAGRLSLGIRERVGVVGSFHR